MEEKVEEVIAEAEEGAGKGNGGGCGGRKRSCRGGGTRDTDG